tara:strand:+ start:1512 stop:1802 length:291 start_codon:yes stop_codon:yes gene_type:complete
MGSYTRTKKYKTYLFLCNENKPVYHKLISRNWSVGDVIVLPPLRVRAKESRLYGNKYYIYLSKMPTIYGESGWLPKAAYKVVPKSKSKKTWKLVQI